MFFYLLSCFAKPIYFWHGNKFQMLSTEFVSEPEPRTESNLNLVY